MLGGHAGRVRGALAGRGALGIVNRFIEVGKPVFPVPFSGGRSDDVFQDVLSRWGESPVPQLSRAQFLRLAQPWTSGTGQLGDLLLGALAETPDIFISYRRDDTAWVSGRLHRDLSDYFGTKRVFMDLDDIAPGDSWTETIQRALTSSRVGVVVIGDRWLEPDGLTRRPRLDDEADVVRTEIKTLLQEGKVVIVVLAGAAPPRSGELPRDLSALSQLQGIAITNATWDVILQQIIGTIRRALAV
jgi:hypothetical protein